MARTRVPFRLEGAEELRAALIELPKATRRSTLRRILKTVIKPLANAVIARAPFKWGDLREHLFTGTKLTRRQRSMADKPGGVELHFGTADPAGMMNEFGREGQFPQPFFRSEWEARKWKMLDDMKRELWDEIMKSVGRFRRKAERRGRR
jgi:hypothetical protein